MNIIKNMLIFYGQLKRKARIAKIKTKKIIIEIQRFIVAKCLRLNV